MCWRPSGPSEPEGITPNRFDAREGMPTRAYLAGFAQVVELRLGNQDAPYAPPADANASS